MRLSREFWTCEHDCTKLTGCYLTAHHGNIFTIWSKLLGLFKYFSIKMYVIRHSLFACIKWVPDYLRGSPYTDIRLASMTLHLLWTGVSIIYDTAWNIFVATTWLLNVLSQQLNEDQNNMLSCVCHENFTLPFPISLHVNIIMTMPCVVG